MPSLGDFLSGYRGREAQMNAAPVRELQQVGALQGILAKVQAAKQEQAYRSGLRPDMTPEERIAHTAQFVGPEAQLRTDTAALDRQQARKVEAAKLVQQHQFRLDEIKQRSTDQGTLARDLLSEKQAFEERMKQFMVANRAPAAPQPVTSLIVKDATSPTGWSYKDGRTGRELSKGAPPPAGARSGGGDDLGVAPPSGETAVNPNVRGPAATGGSGFFGNIANTVSDAVGAKMPYPDVEQASQALTNLRIQTMTMAQDSIPGRPSNYLMQQLEKLSVKPNSMLMADQRSKVRLEQTRDMLKQEVRRMEREILNRPQQFQKATLSKTRNSHGQLRQLISEYDTVINSFDAGPTASGKVGAPRAVAPPPGFKVD